MAIQLLPRGASALSMVRIRADDVLLENGGSLQATILAGTDLQQAA